MIVSKQPKTESIYLELPEGEAVFPWLNTPDTKYNAEGKYKLDLRVPGAEAAASVRQLETIRDAFFAGLSAKDQKTHRTVAVAVAELDDSGAETGNILFRASLNAVGHNKETGETWTQAPRIWDSEGNRAQDVEVWGGSRLVLRVEVRPYAMGSTKTVGVSLRLRDVQVVDLVTGKGASSPFASRTGGFKRPSEPSAGDDQQ